jgi:integrase
MNKRTGQWELLGFSGLNRYRSALQWYLKVQNLTLPQEDEEELSAYFRGTKKREQREKQSGVRDMREGKAEIPFRLYILLAQYWWSVEDYFSLLYLLLTWNLGCRTNNTEGIRLRHISWYEDALQIEFGVTKSNQEGERLEKRLIFANSDSPFICPVLVLAIFLGLRTLELSEDEKLFDGGNQASRFQKSLTEALTNAKVKDCLTSYGLLNDDIGAHSIQKGAGTYLSTGGTQGPNPVAICLRMSWTLGNTKERYLFTSPSSDAYCGRILSGLDQKTVRYKDS